MLRLIALIAQTTLLVLVTYNAVTSLWGWPNPKSPESGTRQRRMFVVVPAHDEETVIEGVLTDLAATSYPHHLVEVRVLADRCTDSTATVARKYGVAVSERAEGQGGKGEALSWLLKTVPFDDSDTLVVFDADNRVPPETLARISDELDAGASVVQCYLDVVDPAGSPIAEAAALSYWAGNRMVQLARTNLGWSADLGGTGMAFTIETLNSAGGFSNSLTEDQDLGVRLLLAGHHVVWLHDLRIADEKPRSIGVAMRQRARWMAGKRATRRRHLRHLLSTPTPARLDMAVRLIQPGRSFMALVSGILTLTAALLPGLALLPWPVWAAATAIQVLQPIPYLIRDRVAPARIARYPVLALLAALWVPIRILSSAVRGWYHTPHVGLTSYDGDDEGPGTDPTSRQHRRPDA